MTAASTARYYSDAEIACVTHQMLTGLDLVLSNTPSPPWARASDSHRQLVTAMVVACRRGCTAADLYRMQTGNGEPAWEDAGRAEQLRWVMFTLVVGAMAAEER